MKAHLELLTNELKSIYLNSLSTVLVCGADDIICILD
jgi:hypothetical protein